MIVRQSVRCDVCNQVHVTRTGLGRSNRQEHIFPCHNCQLEIGFKMNLDQHRGAIEYAEFVQCAPCEEEPSAPIVNLEADFLIPKSMQGVDFSFARMQQLKEITEAREASGTIEWRDIGNWPHGARAGNITGEWEDLRRAWLLTRRGQKPLAKGALQHGTKSYYSEEPLASLADWLFRFNQFLCGQPLADLLTAASDELKGVVVTPQYATFLNHYEANMAHARGRVYLDIYNSFFAVYGDFQQLTMRLGAGLPIDGDLEVSSAQFERTKMFYGNAFEALGTLADFLAFSNNVKMGRAWDTFEQLTASTYLKLDKSSRFTAFAATPGLAALCAEADNQLRNASHHGGIEIDAGGKVVSYRAGKGGQGDTNSMTYTEYLRKCIVLFVQIVSIHMVELVVTQKLQKGPF